MTIHWIGTWNAQGMLKPVPAQKSPWQRFDFWWVKRLEISKIKLLLDKFDTGIPFSSRGGKYFCVVVQSMLESGLQQCARERERERGLLLHSRLPRLFPKPLLSFWSHEFLIDARGGYGPQVSDRIFSCSITWRSALSDLTRGSISK